jgi:hypothetical protein
MSRDLDFTARAVTVRNTVPASNSPRSTAIRANSLLGVHGLLDAVLEARLLGRNILEHVLTKSRGSITAFLLNLVLTLETRGLAFSDGTRLIGVSDAVAFQGDHVRVGNAHISGLQNLTAVDSLADPADGIGFFENFLHQVRGV